jgi:putative PEP-CTERM system histidine kinase
MLTFPALLSFAGALLCGGLAAFVLSRDPRLFAHRAFAVGMIALGLEAVFLSLSAQAAVPDEVIHWQRLRLFATAFLPGTWLLFSLSFAQVNYQESVTRWRWVVLGVFLFPLSLVSVFSAALFMSLPAVDESARLLLPLGWSGYVFFDFLLLSAVLILMNLERTLRASAGNIRWQIKFMILGLGSLFAVRIYTASQVLLFSAVDMTLEAVNAGALIMADALIIFSLVRARLLPIDIYLSQGFLYNSITVLVVGIYLLMVGVLAKVVSYLGHSQSLPLDAFFVLLALLGLTTVLLSEQLRQEMKRFISRNFYRSHYDYRKEWTTFTQRTTSLLDSNDLCAAVTKMVSETFGVACVTIWLLDETQERLVLGGSTVFSEAQAHSLKIAGKESVDLICTMRTQQIPIDCDRAEKGWSREHTLKPAYLREAQIRYCVPLRAGRAWLGLMTLNDRLTNEPFSLEDYDLLKTIADQTASSLLNLQLSHHLAQAKEMEAFQTLSTFFLHDLKNMTSTLSLAMQNLPTHYDDPAFRADILRVIKGSVAKINTLCTRLALLTKKMELQWTEADLNELVRDTLADLNGSMRATLIQDLRPLPRVTLDPEQMQKVLLNLLLNANEAVEGQGEIRVATEQRDGWVSLSVRDNGCGMSPEFIEHSLFQLFHTTKSKGLGIGLFQSKKIVEAHHGRIEVESEEGKGSTFRVLLPPHT